MNGVGTERKKVFTGFPKRRELPALGDRVLGTVASIDFANFNLKIVDFF